MDGIKKEKSSQDCYKKIQLGILWQTLQNNMDI